MTIDLLTLSLYRHANSWVSLLGIGNRSLFYIEWTPEPELRRVELFFIQVI